MFKSLTILELTSEEAINTDCLYKDIFKLLYCDKPSFKESYGLIPVKDNWGELVHKQSGMYWLRVKLQTRKVGKDKLNDAVNDRLSELVGLGEIESLEEVDKETLDNVTQAVESSLLPTADYTNKFITLFIDFSKGLVYIDSSSGKEVKCVQSLLEKLFLDVQFKKLSVEGLSGTLTTMLRDSTLPDPLEWGEKITLFNKNTKQKGTLTSQYVDCGECSKMISTGKTFKDGQLTYDGFLQMTLTEDFIMKGMKWDATIQGEDEDDTFTKTLDYVTVEVGNLVDDLKSKLSK